MQFISADMREGGRETELIGMDSEGWDADVGWTLLLLKSKLNWELFLSQGFYIRHNILDDFVMAIILLKCIYFYSQQLTCNGCVNPLGFWRWTKQK